MAFLADDDVVVNGDTQPLADLDDFLGHVDIGAGGRLVAGRMVVHQPVKLGKLLYFNRVSKGADEVVPVSGVCNSRQFGTIPV